MKKSVIDEIIAWFEENEEVWNDCIEELDSYDGYLGDDRYYPMDELDELYHDTDPSEILRLAFFGHDEETWSTDSHGNKEYGQFNPNRDYFTFNGYGNLVSADSKDYTAFLDHYTIERMSEYRRRIYTISDCGELSSLFDKLEDDEEETA